MPEKPEQPAIQVSDPNEDTESSRPELDMEDGELAPFSKSAFPWADLTEAEEKELKRLADSIGNLDVAARRFEVSQSWQSRLYHRGYQYLWPRRGGGWIYIPFATDYQQSRGGQALYGNETNIYATYSEIICAALTRDIPGVRFDPMNPSSDGDITAADAGTKYARLFKRGNDLLGFQHQLAYYLCVDGRALIFTDHILDAQRFGRFDSDTGNDPGVVPETEHQGETCVAYTVRHGETDRNRDDEERGRDEVPLNQKGERQMDRAGDWLKGKGITLVVSSPVERALSSADIIAKELGVPVEIDDRFASLDIGEYAGEDSQAGAEGIGEAFDEHPDQPIGESGESPEDFQDRIQEAMMEWLGKATPESKIAFLVHNSVISEIYKMLNGEDIPAGSEADPGWIVGLSPTEDGTFDAAVVFPVTPPIDSVGDERGMPRGQEISQVYGKLEHKVPFNSGTNGELGDCLWCQISVEYDTALLKAKYPKKADKIKEGGSAAGENELDRIARINANLALEASYVTGDSMVRDCTEQQTWIRPGYFMRTESPELRRIFFQKFPDGAKVVQCGDAFISARNECMDDHLRLVHAGPGSGMNRLALSSKLLSVQKRLNNWMDLLDAFFIRCVPQRYVAQGPFDVSAMKQQGNVPGGYVPFLLDEVPANRNVQDLIWMEPYPQAQPLMGEFIKFFINELPQMLSHALPSLFGAMSNTDQTATAVLTQRDQALGSLGSPWHNIQMATAGYFKQAVQLAAQNRIEAIEGMDESGSKIRVELANLKGNVLAYPESDANFPESWIQRQSRWQQIIADAMNPFVQRLMGKISNRLSAVQALAIPGVEDPDKAGYEKQMGEFEVLLSMAPLQNPEYQQAEAAIQESQQMIAAKQEQRIPASDQDIQVLQQMEQKLQTMPQYISTVPVKDSDNHAAEAEACLDRINSPEGRKLADGDDKDRSAFMNLTLHWQEHKAKIPPPLALNPLPKGVTANLKDMPPDASAKALQAIGLESSGQDVVAHQEFSAELKKSTKIGGPAVPGMEGLNGR